MRKRSSRATRQMTRQLDQALRTMQNAPQPPPEGWLRAIREALGMTRDQFAKRLGIARPNTYKLEADEVSGAASLARLRRAVEALDCKLVYALVPKTSLEETVRRQALKQAKRRLEQIHVSQALEASAVASESLLRQVEDLAAEIVIDRPNSLWDD